jgi:hypothetical protein
MIYFLAWWWVGTYAGLVGILLGLWAARRWTR